MRRTVLVSLASTIAMLAGCGLSPAPTPSPPAQVAPPSLRADLAFSFPTSVGPLPVLTASDVLAQRASGQLENEEVALRGFWSVLPIDHTCAAPDPKGPQPGALELYCSEGEWGISERNEWVEFLTSDYQLIAGRGPHLIPFVEGPAGTELFSRRVVDGRQFVPIPIVVTGHFDDPRAADCRPQALQRCKDRLVIDQLAFFDWQSVLDEVQPR
jgi:hypothetical protein